MYNVSTDLLLRSTLLIIALEGCFEFNEFTEYVGFDLEVVWKESFIKLKIRH
jgi:hypothetical protein